jgi:hypothetical protein
MRRTSIIVIFFIFFATICGIRVLAQAPATAGPERGTVVLEGGGTRVVSGPLKRTAVI